MGSIRRLVMVSAVLAVLAGTAPGFAQGGEITVAAASDLNVVFKEMVAGFEQRTGHRIKLSLGSSGSFFAQLSNGAPFDLFFSADMSYPRKLAEAGLADPATLFMYGVGRIVLWVPNGSLIDVGALGMAALRHPSVRKIAIANPRHAPYGRAAVAAMEQSKVYDAVKDNLVMGENILQAAQFVQVGGAEIGIIARSLAVAPVMADSGRFWDIPPDTYPRLEQGAVMMNQAKDPQAARAFLGYVRGPEGREALARYGLSDGTATP